MQVLASFCSQDNLKSIETKFRSLVYSARHAYNEMWNLQTIGSPETDQKRSTFI